MRRRRSTKSPAGSDCSCTPKRKGRGMGGLLVLREPLHDLRLERSVGRVQELRIEARASSQDGAAVAERLEAVPAVVGAHAALADAAEGERGVGDVEDGAVHARAPGARLREYALL